ncbi:MAG: tRNA guanosine(34) transglycosylase Tgt [Armatimonadetes bacterium]|nr:tRNA guanosine(34) transglycosylase Tgt [Armatimonadota bacterium]
MAALRFELVSQCPHTGARRGRLHTAHGVIETPAFMPVGTQGSVKTVGSDDLEALGFGLVLSNTYHLGLRPGADLVQQFGGLHKFMSWPGAILTDSGGYQVMSLSQMRQIGEEGVRFKSHLDGSEMFLSPERSIEIQMQLGVDIMMALDVCPPYPCSREEAAEAMERTHRWASRNLGARDKGTEARGDGRTEGGSLYPFVPPSLCPALFGIVQGGVHEDLRRESAQFISSLPFDGVAIGGVSVGEPTEMQRPVVEFTAPLLPAEKPRYLMGVGHPQDILHAVACGVDLFDCVLPTRMARHHSLYTLQGRVNALNAKWADHDGPFDAASVFPATERYSAAYLRHLFKAGEPLGPRLATLHNLAFYARLMEDIRLAIESGGWDALRLKYSEA